MFILQYSAEIPYNFGNFQQISIVWRLNLVLGLALLINLTWKSAKIKKT